jgi:hypothetical protein
MPQPAVFRIDRQDALLRTVLQRVGQKLLLPQTTMRMIADSPMLAAQQHPEATIPRFVTLGCPQSLSCSSALKAISAQRLKSPASTTSPMLYSLPVEQHTTQHTECGLLSPVNKLSTLSSTARLQDSYIKGPHHRKHAHLPPMLYNLILPCISTSPTEARSRHMHIHETTHTPDAQT